jgi:methylglyoxal synthase
MKNKTIALIAHDRKKYDMIGWVKHNAETLLKNKLICTGTTGELIEKALTDWINARLTYLGWNTETKELDNFYKIDKLDLVKMNSGPMGGDAQIASMVVEGKIDMCVFLIDDLLANPHEADIQMLLRQCRIHNIPVACNRHSADLMMTSDLWGTDYIPTVPTYKEFKR